MHKLINGLEPKEGDIVKGYELGINAWQKYIYSVCPNCNKLRWTQCINNKPRWPKCKVCVGKESVKKNPIYRNGIYISNGYRYIKLDLTHKFYSMVKKDGYVKLSRLVVAERLGRCLTTEEIVHHINGNTLNDDDSNLMLCHNIKEHQNEHWNKRNENKLYFINKKGYHVLAKIRKCIDCNKEKLTSFSNKSLRCSSCAVKHRNKLIGHGVGGWKGGISLDKKEYARKYRETKLTNKDSFLPA